MMNFRELIDDVRRRGRAAHLRPVPVAVIAKRCGISVPYLYNLIWGTRKAPEWTVARIAKGLRVDAARVQRALDKAVEGAPSAKRSG